MKTATKQRQADPMLVSTFSKYDFVKSYIKDAKTAKEKIIKEREASLIADAIKENNDLSIKDLATKDDLKDIRNELKTDIYRLDNKIELLGRDLTIRITVIMATLLALFKAFDKFI